MGFVFEIAMLAGGLFVGMLVLLEVGRRLGLRRIVPDSDVARSGFGVVEGAIFALMGLLIAFTFSGAASRFDMRRHLPECGDPNPSTTGDLRHTLCAGAGKLTAGGV
jgi:hypothetical protein